MYCFRILLNEINIYLGFFDLLDFIFDMDFFIFWSFGVVVIILVKVWFKFIRYIIC